MVQLYNFIGSWQLFPEKGAYERGERPKSGIYKIAATQNKKEVLITSNWVTLTNDAFATEYTVTADGELHSFTDKNLADDVQVSLIDSINFELHFYKKGTVVLHIAHEILPNGYLKLVQQGFEGEASYTNTEIY